MPRRNSVTLKLALTVVTLLILSGLGYWTVQHEVAEIQSTLERGVDASQAMLRSAYEMELLIADVSTFIRGLSISPVAPPKLDLVQRRAAFDELLGRFLANTRVAETRTLAGEVEVRLGVYLDQAVVIVNAHATLIKRLARLSRSLDALDVAAGSLAATDYGQAISEYAGRVYTAAAELVDAGRQFVNAGTRHDASQLALAAIRLDNVLDSVPPGLTESVNMESFERVTVARNAQQVATQTALDARRILDTEVVTASTLREPVQGLIHERLQRAADSEVERARREVDQQIGKARRRLTALLLFAAVLGFGVTFLLARTIAGPVRSVVGALRALGGGNFATRLPVTGKDEFSDMAVAFNQTADELQRLTVTRAFLDDIQRSLADGVFVVDREFRVQSLNRAAVALLDLPARDVEGQPLNRFLCLPGERALTPDAHAISRIECALTGASGVPRPVLCSLAPLSGERPDTARYVCTITDITELKQAEEAVVASREELRAAYVALQRVQEEERRQIANEVHDEFGAILTVMNSTLFLLRDAAADLAPAVQPLIGQLHDLIAQASQTTDRIVDGLHPPILEHFGLAAAIEWYAERFESWTGIHVRLSLSCEPELEPESEVAIFRVAQECLTNVARHARAHTVEVSLWESDGALCLLIEDDGVGCLPSDLSTPNRHGLRGLRERIASLGGTVQAAPRAGTGLSVIARLPLPAAAVLNAEAHG